MDDHHVSERRIFQFLADGDLLLVKTFVIMLRGEHDRRIERGTGLHENFPLDFSASGAPGNLREELERTFRRAEIRHEQPHVRIYDPDQRHIREMQPLGDHLGADQDVQFAAPEL